MIPQLTSPPVNQLPQPSNMNRGSKPLPARAWPDCLLGEELPELHTVRGQCLITVGFKSWPALPPLFAILLRLRIRRRGQTLPPAQTLKPDL